jgi:hypothetical protein
VHGLGGVVLRHAVDIRLRRRGVETKLVLAGGERPARTARVDPALAKAILRAHDWFERLATGRARSFAEIAHDEDVTGRYVAHVLPLAFLAPEVVSSILAGKQPVDLTANRLIKQIDLPPGWAEQRASLGFEDPS